MSNYRKKMCRTSDINIRKSVLWTFCYYYISIITLYNIIIINVNAAAVILSSSDHSSRMVAAGAEDGTASESLPSSFATDHVTTIGGILLDMNRENNNKNHANKMNYNENNMQSIIQIDSAVYEHVLSTKDNQYLILSGKNFLMLKTDKNGNSFEKTRNSIKITPTYSPYECDAKSEAFEFIVNNDNEILISLDKFNFNNNKYSNAYLCITELSDQQPDGQKSNFRIELKNEEESLLSDIREETYHIRDNILEMRHLGERSKFTSKTRHKRQTNTKPEIHIEGFRIEGADKPPTLNEDGIPEIFSNTDIKLRLFGNGLTEHTVIIFTQEAHAYGGSCQLPETGVFEVIKGTVTKHSALVAVKILKGDKKKPFYICAKQSDNSQGDASHTTPYIHQGGDSWLQLFCYDPLIPIWASIIIIVLCLMFSALFSGLNLGLMSLDRTDLKILCNTGTENEKKYARAIQPVRDHGNFLLCSILLGNVLVNSTFTILLDDLTSGLVAVLGATIAIVIFGEITPQALCSRHGLAVGAKTILITKAVMLITFPLSYPTSKILDCLLGEEIGNFYNRERLKELVKVTTDVNELDKNEVNIISGVLELRKKTVGDIMTHLDDAFMLSIETILDFETVSEIMKSGFSRIPVFENERNNIITLLYIKDLAFIDTDDNTPLRTLCQFYQNPCHFVFDDVTLDVMFNQFKEGHKGHMAFVHRVNNEGDGDPFYETIGLVTLEDVIEELIQSEIVDETDVFTDNRTKVRRTRLQKQDFTIFAEKREQKIQVSPQLILATFQYLSAAIDLFKPENISPGVLRRLLNEDVVQLIKCKGKEKNDPSLYIYSQGKAADFFVIILEGRVEVTIGRENLTFDSGPFTSFGTQALTQNIAIDLSPQQLKGSIQSLNMDLNLRHTFIPDYSIKALGDVIYVSISRQLYLAAKKATLMQRMHKYEAGSEPLDMDVEKLLHSLEEDERSLGNNGGNLNSPRDSKPLTPRMSPDNPHQNGPTTTTSTPSYSSVLFNSSIGSRKNSAAILPGSSTAQQNPSQTNSINANNTNTNPPKESDDSNAPLLPKPKS